MAGAKIDYWGLMLEFAPEKKYDWQKASGTKPFLALDPVDAHRELEDVLLSSIESSIEAGLNMAIWSSEFLLKRHENILPVLVKLKQVGVNLKVLSYVRKYDSWAESAYGQWGLKHKSYLGPLRGFSDYIKRSPVSFYSSLKTWSDTFRGDFKVVNFDEVENVVASFQLEARIPFSLPSIRVNERLSDEELYLRALFNSAKRKKVAVREFDRVFKLDSIDLTRGPGEWLSSYMPTADDLRSVVEEASDDIDSTNALLKACGQPELDNTPIEPRVVNVDPEKLLGFALQMIVRQQSQIAELSSRVSEFENVEPQVDSVELGELKEPVS